MELPWQTCTHLGLSNGTKSESQFTFKKIYFILLLKILQIQQLLHCNGLATPLLIAWSFYQYQEDRGRAHGLEIST